MISVYSSYSRALLLLGKKTAADLCVKKTQRFVAKKSTDSYRVPLFTQVKCYQSVSFCRINAGNNSGELLLVIQVSLTSNHNPLGLRRSRSMQ
jgi:hypothetical protein